MDVLTSQQITMYYDRYKTTELILNKEIIEASGLIASQVYLKCGTEQWHCLVYAFSFESARVVVDKKEGLLHKFQEAHQFGKLNFCFTDADTGSPLVISVSGRSMGYSPYRESDDMIFVNLQFTGRPPDDLIIIMGRVLDAHVNFSQIYQRKKRILINTNTLRELKILSRDLSISIQGASRQCVLQDISFCGARIIIMGAAKFLEDLEVVLSVEFENPEKTYHLRGRFVSPQAVDGHNELVSIGISFDEDLVPMGYKIRINDYIGDLKADAGKRA